MQNPHTLKNRTVRLLSETLPAENIIISLDNPEHFTQAGHYFTAPPKIAARGLIEKTHRLATPEEARAHVERQRVRRAEILRVERDRRANMNISVTIPAPASAPVVELMATEPEPERVLVPVSSRKAK